MSFPRFGFERLPNVEELCQNTERDNRMKLGITMGLYPFIDFCWQLVCWADFVEKVDA